MKIDTDTQQFIGCAFGIFLLLLGMGGCACLFSLADKIGAEAHSIRANP